MRSRLISKKGLTMRIEVGDRLQSAGFPGTVIATNRNDHSYPVVFLLDNGMMLFFTATGDYIAGDVSDKDLMPLTPKVKEHWINVSVWNSKVITCAYPTKEKADKDACKDRVACVRVREGEFH